VSFYYGLTCGTLSSLGGSSVRASQAVGSLSPGTSYCVEVTASSGGGTGRGLWGNITTQLAAPTGFSISALSATSFTVSWTNPSGTLASVGVAYGTSCGALTGVGGSAVRTSQSLTGLSPVTSYCIEVTASTAAATSPGLWGNQTTLSNPPTGLAFTAVTNASFTVGWTNPSGALTGDAVEYGTSCASLSPVGGGGIRTSQSIRSLGAATAYCVEVTATSAAGSSVGLWGNETTLPNAPTTLSFSSVTSSGFTLSWTNPGGTLVSDSVAYGTSCGSLGAVGGSSVRGSQALSSLAAATSYCVEVTASSAGGASPGLWGNQTTLPSAPTGLSFSSVTASSFTVSWTNPSGTLTSVALEYGTSCGSLSAAGGSSIRATQSLASLAGATSYCVEVRASSAGGASAGLWGNQTTLPDAPSGLTFSSVTNASVTVSWSNPSGVLTGVTVRYGTGCGSLSTVGSGTRSSQALTSLAGATRYCVEVYDSSAGGDSAGVWGNQTTLPDAPTDLVATTWGTGEIDLAWTNPSGALTNDTVYDGPSCAAIAGRSLGVAGSDAVDGLSENTPYCFAVEAWSAGGGSTSYAWANASTEPDAPTGLSISNVNATGFTVSWTNPSGALTGNSVGAGSDCGSLTLTGGTAVRSRQAFGSLMPGTTYCVEVTATGSGGASVGLWGNATTLPAPPSGLGFSDVTTTGFTASWTNPGGPLTAVGFSYGRSCDALAGLGGPSVRTSQVVGSLPPGTTYCVEVTVGSAAGTSLGLWGNVTTLLDPPTGIGISQVTSSSFTVSWTDPSGPLTAVIVAYGATCGALTEVGGSAVRTSQSVDGLDSATSYCVEVTAATADAISRSLEGSQMTRPDAPTGLSISMVSGSGFSVTWSNPTGTLSNDTLFLGASCAATVAHSVGVASSYLATGLASATSYCIGVEAWSSAGASLTNPWLNQTTLPDAPTDLTARVVSASQVDLAWTNPSGTLTNDSVAYGTSCTARASQPEGVVAGTPLTGLAANTRYCFAVQAESAGGGSPYAWTNATTDPDAPTDLVASAVSSSRIDLTWTNPAGPLTNDTVYYGPSCQALAALSVGVASSTTLTGLSENTRYCVAVEAWAASEGSPTFAWANATTTPTGATFLGHPPFLGYAVLGLMAALLLLAAILIVAAKRRRKERREPDGPRPSPPSAGPPTPP
jgi:phenolic acid decarboxylase